MLRHRAYLETQIALQPGDRLVLVTDGMLERGAAALELPTRLQHLSRLHPREVVRILGDLVLEVAGPTLQDDACLLVLDWHGGHGTTRNTDARRRPPPQQPTHHGSLVTTGPRLWSLTPWGGVGKSLRRRRKARPRSPAIPADQFDE